MNTETKYKPLRFDLSENAHRLLHIAAANEELAKREYCRRLVLTAIGLQEEINKVEETRPCVCGKGENCICL